jgi:hypothetical protein
MASSIFLFIFAFFLFGLPSFALNVSHDGRTITIDGERRILLSGSIHYPRSTPGVSFHRTFSTVKSFKLFIFCFLKNIF